MSIVTRNPLMARVLIAVAAGTAIAGGAIGMGIASASAPSLTTPVETSTPAPADPAEHPTSPCTYRPQIRLIALETGPVDAGFTGDVGTVLYRKGVCGDQVPVEAAV